MSKTAIRDDRNLDHELGPAASPLVPPPKLRRRPALLVVGVLAVALGAVLAGWAWSATSNTHEVLIARHTIERGSVIEADDLARVQVNADPALSPVSADRFDDVVGQRAAFDVAGGAMLTPDSFSSSVVPSGTNSVVGVALTSAQVPGLDLATGDHVRVIVMPSQGDEMPSGAPAFSEATVAGVHASEESGQVIVDLLVPHADAALLAARAATGNVSLVLDSRDR